MKPQAESTRPHRESFSWLSGQFLSGQFLSDRRLLLAFEVAVAINVIGCLALLPALIDRRERYAAEERAG